MRINGFEQIKGFYSWSFSNQDKGVKPQHISLYLFLVNQNNRNNWVEWFKLPYDLAMAGSCISSKKTYYACLDDLVTWKLVKYQKGVNNWKAPLIKLEVLKDTSTVPQSEPQVLQADVPQHIQELIQASIPQPTHNIKLLTNNLKPITDNIKQVLEFLGIIDFEEITLDDNFKKLKNELCISLVDFFEFNGSHYNKQRMEISAFVKTQVVDESFYNHFLEQFQNYQDYKELTKEQKHHFNTYLGTQNEAFEDGQWNKENWGAKLEKAKSTTTSKFDRTKQAYNDATNPYEK